jgi:hypothetical protein
LRLLTQPTCSETFMGDESIDRKVWPITRYIIEQLMMPK